MGYAQARTAPTRGGEETRGGGSGAAPLESTEYLARPSPASQNGAMESGTSLARSRRMNEEHPAPCSTQLVTPRAPEAPSDEEAARQADPPQELDKYDLATLACTD